MAQILHRCRGISNTSFEYRVALLRSQPGSQQPMAPCVSYNILCTYIDTKHSLAGIFLSRHQGHLHIVLHTYIQSSVQGPLTPRPGNQAAEMAHRISTWISLWIIHLSCIRTVKEGKKFLRLRDPGEMPARPTFTTTTTTTTSITWSFPSC